MTNKKDFFHCKRCGLTVEALTNGAHPSCCGEAMELLAANSKEAAVEKHIPVVEKTANGYKVTVGSVEHPMLDEHYIQWIQLDEGDTVQIKFLNAGEAPQATFVSDATAVKAYEFCNLHGLWVK